MNFMKTNFKTKIKLIFTELAVFLLLLNIFVVSASAASVGAPNNNGLVGYWKFDEGVGTKARDYSGNGNTGTITNASWITGKLGKALNMNGSGYVNVPVSGTAFARYPISFTFWAKTTSGGFVSFIKRVLPLANGSTLYDQGINILVTGGGTNTLGIRVDSAVVQNSAIYPASPAINDDKWHFMTVTMAANGATVLYVDGLQTGSATLGALDSSGGTFGFPSGNDNGLGTGQSSNTKMDDVRIYNRVLSATEIKNLYQSGSALMKPANKTGLVGYWPMDEGTGSRANDMSGRGNKGTITNPSWVAGKFGKGLNFNGSSSYITAGSGSSLEVSDTVTLSAWVKSPDWHPTAVWRAIFDKGSYGIYVQPSSNVLRFQLVLTTTGIVTVDSNALNTNQWYHVVGTYDKNAGANNLKIYINGVLHNSSTQSNSVVAGNVLNMGLYSGNYFNGTMDDLRVYNRALTLSEISDLYRSGSFVGNSGNNNLLTNGLMYHFSLNGNDINWATNTAYDRSGQGNNSPLVSFSTTSSAVAGKIGQGLNFNGLSTYINTPAFSFLGQVSASFTVSAWVKPRAISGSIFNNDGGGWNTGLLGFHLGKLSFYIHGIGYLDSPNSAVTNRWVFVTATRDGATGINRLYENGVQVNTNTGAYGASGGSNRFAIGIPNVGCCQMDTPGYFNGIIDDARLYNRALSASEVKQLYNASR
jgi:hypothetical protein